MSLACQCVQAQRRKAWGALPTDAASSMIRPRPHGRSAFTCHVVLREAHERSVWLMPICGILRIVGIRAILRCVLCASGF